MTIESGAIEVIENYEASQDMEGIQTKLCRYDIVPFQHVSNQWM